MKRLSADSSWIDELQSVLLGSDQKLDGTSHVEFLALSAPTFGYRGNFCALIDQCVQELLVERMSASKSAPPLLKI